MRGAEKRDDEPGVILSVKLKTGLCRVACGGLGLRLLLPQGEGIQIRIRRRPAGHGSDGAPSRVAAQIAPEEEEKVEGRRRQRQQHGVVVG